MEELTGPKCFGCNWRAMIVQLMMLIPLLLSYMGSANRKWRPNKSRYSGLDLNKTLFLVKEAVVNSTPDEKN